MILEQLAAAARRRVAHNQTRVSLEQMKTAARILNADTGFPFEQALRGPEINFICEIKKASPSLGLIAPDFPCLQIALEYEQGGAAAISVLTEPEYFLGSDQHLVEIQKAVSIPVLRKDFTVDAYQLYEAKTIGASAVLLICALHNTPVLRDYISICDELGLSALVEAHDEREVASALAAGARIIGVNNRNLKDFTVNLDNSIRLRKLVPENIIFVAESGIRTAADIEVLRQAKVNAVLIGGALMRSPDKKKMLAELRGDDRWRR
jgi:indole-3-glycerol phosphate synthase